MNRRYILKDRVPVPCEDLMTWARWWEVNENRRVADIKMSVSTLGEPGERVCRVSTFFIGLDLNPLSFKPEEPLLFETLVQGGPLDGTSTRSSTWKEAEERHEAMVEYVRESFRR